MISVSKLSNISNNRKIGAVASFVGLVRDVAMTLEHYPGMTERAIAKIVDEAKARWQVMDCAVIHRYGALQAQRPDRAGGGGERRIAATPSPPANSSWTT